MNKDQIQPNTVFHITHWKAGSQWLHRILRDVALERIIPPQLSEKQFLHAPLIDGAIYPTVYVTREQFQSVSLPANYKKFVIIRDLRDTLVSAYFSIRYSHVMIAQSLAAWRERLESSSMEDGLLMLMEEWLPSSGRIQESWVKSGEKFIRYEDMLKNDIEILEKVLIQQCDTPISPERLRNIIIKNRFENLSGGRKPGEENIMAHERKGISGDWKNYFSRTVIGKFNAQYGDLLLAAGYELIDSGAK